MSKMLTLAFISGIILLGTLTLASNIQQVKAIGTVYIRADGSIDPLTAPIQRNGDLYTLTGNIISDADGIVVERDNIVLDGAGHILQGSGLSNHDGIILTDRSQVTIKNTKIREFNIGMRVYQSTGLNISGNKLTSNSFRGIYLWASDYNTISENNLTENNNQLDLEYSSSNNITRNNIANSTRGLILRSGSSNNLVLGNTFTNDGLYVSDSYENVVEGNTVNGRPLVYLEGASDRTVDDAGQVILVNCNSIKAENLNISNTSYGLQLLRTNNSIIANNNVASNAGGISLRGSSNNSIVRNKIAAGKEVGIYLRFSSNNSIVGNNITNNVVGVALEYSPSNTITENNITANGHSGLSFSGSDYNRVYRNNLAKNNNGIRFGSCSSNNVYENNITLSHEYEVYLHQSSDNKFYHNNFVENANPVFASAVSVWDNGYFSGGNYWSDYTIVDEKSGPNQDQPGSDGIGDTPHRLGADNSDRYPLVDLYSIVPSYPIAVFTYSPSDPISSQTVIFNASNSTSENGTITTYYWRFGDGAFSGGSVTTHEYASYGDYKITLTAISNSRLLSNQTRMVYVREKPTANFQVFPTFNLSAGQAITFNASSSNPHGGNITDYIWNFGDGNTTSTAEPVVTHTYSQAKTYNVTLTVQDSEDLNSSYFQTIKVWMPTSISISTSSASTFVGFKVNITGTLRDIYGNGLKNEMVVLYYTFSGISTWTPITSSNTDSAGNHQAVWIPPATGSFTVKAEWAGNSTFVRTHNETNLNILFYEDEYVFSVESNSTVSSLDFESSNLTLKFTVAGPPETKGYVKVTIANRLVENIEDVEVKVNDEEVDYTITPLDDSYLLYLTYPHSTHKVTITLSRTTASFIETLPVEIVVFAAVSITAIAILTLAVLKRKLKSNEKESISAAES